MGATVRLEGPVTQTGVGEHFLEDGTLMWSLGTAHTHSIRRSGDSFFFLYRK